MPGACFFRGWAGGAREWMRVDRVCGKQPVL